MNFQLDFNYNSEANIVYAKVAGDMNVTDIHGYAQRILDDNSIKPGYIEVVDFTDIGEIKATAESIFSVEEIFKRLVTERHFAGSVVLVPTDYIFGMIRMMTTTFQRLVPIRYVRSDSEIPDTIQEIRQLTTK